MAEYDDPTSPDDVRQSELGKRPSSGSDNGLDGLSLLAKGLSTPLGPDVKPINIDALKTSLGKLGLDENNPDHAPYFRMINGLADATNNVPHQERYTLAHLISGIGTAGLNALNPHNTDPGAWNRYLVQSELGRREDASKTGQQFVGGVIQPMAQMQLNSAISRDQATLNALNRDRTQRGLAPFPSIQHARASLMPPAQAQANAQAQGGGVMQPQLHPAGTIPPAGTPTTAPALQTSVPGIVVQPQAGPAPQQPTATQLPPGPQRARPDTSGSGYAPLSPEDQAQLWAHEAEDPASPPGRRMAARQAYQLYRSEEGAIQSRLAIGGGAASGGKTGDNQAETLDSIGKAMGLYNKVLEASPYYKGDVRTAEASATGRIEDSRKRFEELHKQAEEAGEFLQNGSLFEDALKGAIAKGQTTGPTAEWRLKLRGVLKEAGFNGEDLSDLETMRKTSMQAASSLAKTISSRGATQFEFRTFQDAVPGLSLSPAGNLKLIAAMKEMAAAKIAMRDEAVRYMDEKDSQGQQPVLDRHFEARLTGVQKEAIDKARAAMKDATDFARQTGVLKGGKTAEAGSDQGVLTPALATDLQKRYAAMGTDDRAKFVEGLKSRGIDPAQALGTMLPQAAPAPAAPAAPPRRPRTDGFGTYEPTTETGTAPHELLRQLTDGLSRSIASNHRPHGPQTRYGDQ